MKKIYSLLLILTLLLTTPVIISNAATNVNEKAPIQAENLMSSDFYATASFTDYSGRYYLTDDLDTYYTNYYCDIAVSENHITYQYTLAGIQQTARVAYREKDLEDGYIAYWNSWDEQIFGIYEDFLMIMEPNTSDDPTKVNTDITLYIKLNL